MMGGCPETRAAAAERNYKICGDIRLIMSEPSRWCGSRAWPEIVVPCSSVAVAGSQSIGDARIRIGGRRRRKGARRNEERKDGECKGNWSVQRSFERAEEARSIDDLVGPRVVVVCDAVQESRSELLGMTDPTLSVLSLSQQPLSAKAR